MTPEQHERFHKFITGDDMGFYEEYIIHLSRDEQEKFFEDNPDFMSEFLENCGNIDLLRDRVYRGLLRKIKEYEGGN